MDDTPQSSGRWPLRGQGGRGPIGQAPRKLAVIAAAFLAFVAFGTLRSSAAQPSAGFRPLAPGALTIVPADRSADDPIQRGPLVEVTEGQKAVREWKPKRAAVNSTFVERAAELEYPRDIWCLEFAFKPPRRLEVDIPEPGLRMRRETIWYLVYRVKNVGGRRVVAAVDASGQPDPASRTEETFQQPIRFLPHFVLESREGLGSAEGLASYRAYLDRVLPSAMDAIRRREDPARPLLDSAAMAATPLQPGEERWGVAVWEGIDPRIDSFSIYVRGLTNAIRWRKRPGDQIAAEDPPGEHVEQVLESLRLDFWRPGDEQTGGTIHIGFRGMFERMTLGGRLLAALNWPAYAAARPALGLRRLGLAWNDPGLAEPAGEGPFPSYIPLKTLLEKLARVKDPAARSEAARDLFGDLGVESLEQLARAAAGPVDPGADAARRAALEPMELSPEAVQARPLESLATIARFLEEPPDEESRRRRAGAIFGPTAARLDWLARAAIMARTLATLEASNADPATIAKLDARGAFEAIAAVIKAEPEADREPLILGLFGPQGPALFSEAVAVHEGVEYSWVYRFERPAGGW
ncbi:MAG: hypothetical protein RLZZ440_1112 [Planctomycetota bacterium]